MITRKQVIDVIEDMYGPIDNCTMSEAEYVLDCLDVGDPGERVEWYNATQLDIDDVVRLANVRFRVITCPRCNNRISFGEPENWDEFQGVLQGEYGLAIINNKEVEFCSECYYVVTGWQNE